MGQITLAKQLLGSTAKYGPSTSRHAELHIFSQEYCHKYRKHSKTVVCPRSPGVQAKLAKSTALAVDPARLSPGSTCKAPPPHL